MDKVVFIPNAYAAEGTVIGHPGTVKAVKEEVDRLTAALTTLRESITLAAAPLGITGELEEVVGRLGDEAKRLRGIVEVLEDGCYKCQHPVRVRELTCQKTALQQVVSERDEEIASLRAQLLTAREQGRREMREEAVEVADNVANHSQSYDRVTAIVIRDTIHALPPEEEVCEWRKDPVAGCSTACGRTNSFIMKDAPYCRHCGRPITIKEG